MGAKLLTPEDANFPESKYSAKEMNRLKQDLLNGLYEAFDVEGYSLCRTKDPDYDGDVIADVLSRVRTDFLKDRKANECPLTMAMLFKLLYVILINDGAEIYHREKLITYWELKDLGIEKKYRITIDDDTNTVNKLKAAEHIVVRNAPKLKKKQSHSSSTFGLWPKAKKWEDEYPNESKKAHVVNLRNLQAAPQWTTDDAFNGDAKRYRRIWKLCKKPRYKWLDKTTQHSAFIRGEGELCYHYVSHSKRLPKIIGVTTPVVGLTLSPKNNTLPPGVVERETAFKFIKDAAHEKDELRKWLLYQILLGRTGSGIGNLSLKVREDDLNMATAIMDRNGKKFLCACSTGPAWELSRSGRRHNHRIELRKRDKPPSPHEAKWLRFEGQGTLLVLMQGARR